MQIYLASRKVADKKSDSPLIKKDKKKKSVDFIIPVSNNLLVNSDFEDEAASGNIKTF